jgi:hypothetical protein
MTSGLDARRTMVQVGRAGMICYGVVHLLVAWLAAQIALSGSGQQADQRGAVETLAEQPLGMFLLIVLAVGLAAFGIWQLYVAAQGFRWVNDQKKRLEKRLGALARGVISVLVAAYAVRILTGRGQQSQDPQQEFTARLLAAPAGRLLVGLIAIAVIAVGVSRIVKGVRKKFIEDLDLSQLPQNTQRMTIRIGQIGYPAKGTSIAIIGLLLGLAALRANPGEAGGLDKALRALAAQPYGTFLLLLVAVGLAAFGVYCFASARARRF